MPNICFHTKLALFQEYDYHIQTNSIPNGPVNTIKQVGEKGPIHTIPAPNLSLKDKPTANEVRKEVNYPQTTTYLQVDQSHHYQVTEPPESGQAKLFRAQQQKLQQLQQQQFQQHQLQQQQLYQQQQQFQQLQQQKQQQKLQQQQIQQQKLLQYQQQLIQQQFKQQKPIDQFQQQQSQPSEIQVQPQQVYLAEETSEVHPESLQQDQIQGNIIVNNQVNTKDLYQLLGAAYPQAVVSDGVLQTVKIQPESDFPGDNFYQTNQEFDLNAESTINSQPGTINFKPEFHSFNYDEQAHQASQKDLLKKKFSSLVTATYTLSPGNVFERHGQVETDDAPHKQFESRSDLEVNGVSEETTEKRDDTDKDENGEDKILETSYYSSLPSKEAAERLADLQAAGKINHNLMELSKSKDDMALFISTEKEETKEEKDSDNSQNYPQNSKEQNIEYDEYAQDDNQNLETVEQSSKDFGSRIRPKTKN